MPKPKIWWVPGMLLLVGCHSSGPVARRPGMVLTEDSSPGILITAQCGSAEKVKGRLGARCAALDGICQQGRFDEVNSCCELVVLPPGMVCSEVSTGTSESRLCDGAGECRASAEVPLFPRVMGGGRWLEALSGGGEEPAPIVWHRNDGTLEILFGERPVARVPAAVEGHRLRLFAGQEPASAVSLELPFGPTDLEFSLFLPRAQIAGEEFEVCAAIGRSGAPAAASNGCFGGEAVACPSLAGARIGCSFDERGYAAVTAVGLALVWPKGSAPAELSLPAWSAFAPDAPPSELRRPGSPPLGSGPGGGTFAEKACRQGDTRRCDLRKGCPNSGLQSCTPNGWGACKFRGEKCDGIDEDCDGAIDEGADWACADEAACTLDSCRAGVCHHDRGFFGTGQPGARCLGPALCAAAVCAPLAWDFRDPRDSLTGADANGCRYVLYTSECDRLDPCVCDGTDSCSPWSEGANPRTGCLAPPPGTGPGPEGHHRGCDIDGDRCTQEHICCETSPLCPNLPPGTTQATLDSCRDASMVRGFADVVDGAPVRCLNQAPRVGFNRCHDGNACTRGSCTDPVLGSCSQEPIQAGLTVSSRSAYEPIEPDGNATCDGTIHQGCATRTCDGEGECLGVRPMLNPEFYQPYSTAECRGDPLSHGARTCFERGCSREGDCSAVVPHPERCGDLIGNFAGCPRPPVCDPLATSYAADSTFGCTTDRGCIVDGSTCVAEGATNPVNECQICVGANFLGLDWSPGHEDAPCTRAPDGVFGTCRNGRCI